MALLQECSRCKRRCSAKTKTCKCGNGLGRDPSRVWWISYYDSGKKLVRRRIGLNKAAAEQELRAALSARAEGRSIRRNPDTTTRFKDLAQWYLNLAEVKAKRSYRRDTVAIRPLLNAFGDRVLSAITPAAIGEFRQKRLATPSRCNPGKLVQPSSCNREIALLKTIFSRAIKDGKAEANPAKALKMLRENNSRDRVLTQEEYQRLLAACPPHIRPVVKLAWGSGMRRSEMLNLTWGMVDLQEGFIHLPATHTKGNTARDIPLNQELIQMFKDMPRGLPQVRVFTYMGQPIRTIRWAFNKACAKAGIVDFRLHDLRHCFVSNLYRAGVPIPTIQAITGHKSLIMFMRYNKVQPEDLKAAIAKMV